MYPVSPMTGFRPGPSFPGPVSKKRLDAPVIDNSIRFGTQRPSVKRALPWVLLTAAAAALVVSQTRQAKPPEKAEMAEPGVAQAAPEGPYVLSRDTVPGMQTEDNAYDQFLELSRLDRSDASPEAKMMSVLPVLEGPYEMILPIKSDMKVPIVHQQAKDMMQRLQRDVRLNAEGKAAASALLNNLPTFRRVPHPTEADKEVLISSKANSDFKQARHQLERQLLQVIQQAPGKE